MAIDKLDLAARLQLEKKGKIHGSLYPGTHVERIYHWLAPIHFKNVSDLLEKTRLSLKCGARDSRVRFLIYSKLR